MPTLKFIVQRAIPYRWYILGIFVAMCLVALDNTFKPFLIKQLIDTVAGKQSSSLWTIAIVYGLLQAMLIVSWALSDYCLTRYVARFRLEVAEYLMRRLYDYNYSFFQDHLSGSLTSKVNDVFQYLPHLVYTIVNTFCYSFLLMVISFVLLFSVSWVFALGLSVWVLVFMMAVVFSLRKSMLLNEEYSKEKANIIGLCADYFSNMLNVKVFAAKDYELGRFAKLKRPFIAIAEKGGFYHTRVGVYLGTVASLYVMGSIVFLILGFQKGNLSPGDFALVFMLNLNIISKFFDLYHTLKDFVVDWSAVSHALSVLDVKPVGSSKEKEKILKVSHGKIEFSQVKFQYHGSEMLFNNKSIIIDAGQKVGLVGYSGGGKTTFVHLILRLYDVIGGQILIDGVDISQVNQDSVREAIAMIPQDAELFHRSLMDNIRYGRPKALDEEVIQAAKEAHAHEFISKLSQGYEALVGERGVKLSGGQRQRIAIARAILKDAPILILDEATSQLDSLTEANIQESLLELMQSKTTIVIAHRLSTLLHMDRILVFDKGHIIEDGTHVQLLNQGGLYKTLWDAQVGGFLPDKPKGKSPV